MSVIKNSEIISKIKEVGHVKCGEWLYKYSYSNSHGNVVGHQKSFESLVKTTFSKYRQLLKGKYRGSGKVQFEEFMDLNVNLPKPLGKPRVHGIENSKNVKSLQETVELFKDIAGSVTSENASLRKEVNETKAKLCQKTSKVGNLFSLKESLKKATVDIKSLQHENQSFKARIIAKNTLLKQVRSSRTYVASQLSNLNQEVENLRNENRLLKDRVEELNVSSQNLNSQLGEVMEENEYLRSLLENDQVILFDEETKVYNQNAQQCVYELLSNNVTTSKVSSVIETVLKLANLTPNRLPSLSTVNNMNIQRLILSQRQLAEVLAEKENTCLLSDETSKFGRKIEGFHLRDEEGVTYVLGLRQMVTKSGQDTLSTFQDILSDIDHVSQLTDNPVSRNILLNIVSTMSDRATTQKKFNDLLEEYRRLIVVEHLGQAWQDMSHVEQMSISTLNNFFCGLHALVHMAETAGKCLQVVEDAFFEGEPPTSDLHFKSGKESGSVRLLRTASKAFSCGGDEKSGVYGSFFVFAKEFLNEKNMKSVPIQRFRGNRFNILFSNAANVYFLHEKIEEYLSGDCSNGLLKSVLHDIKTPEYVAGLKALGLISFLVTTPLWCLIENKDIHILDSGIYYNEVITYLEEAVTNTYEFIEGRQLLSFCDEHVLNGDKIFQKVKEQWEHDDKVIAILLTLLPGLCDTLKKMFSEFLDGGEWEQVSPSKRHMTKAVPKHNKYSETIFGHVDRILREKPNISTIAQEAYVMFCHNRTFEWLQGKSEREQEVLMSGARNDVVKARAMFKRRRMEIEERRRQIIRDKFEALQEKERRRVQKLEGYAHDVIKWGLWQTIQQVNRHMSRCKTKKDKVSGLKAQLNFRKEVLKQKRNEEEMKGVYTVTKVVNGKRVCCSEEELCDKVKKLIRYARRLPAEDNSNGPVLNT